MKRPPKKKADWSGLLSDSTHDVRRLSNVIRFSSIPVTYAESTAEHSFWVTLYALMIHRELGGPVSQEASILRHGLTHDLGECVGGDVVRTLKYATKQMKRAVDHAEGVLVKKLLPERVSSLAIEPSAHVRTVVKAADFMSLFHFMRREAARHNYEIIPYYWRMVRDIESMEQAATGALRPLYGEMASEAKSVARECFPNIPTAPAASHAPDCGCFECSSYRRWYRHI